MKLLEIHVLQNFVPSLLNRDDTGSHKDCVFGARRRARISSQCWKRAVREHFRTAQILGDDALALRSKLFHQELENRLLGPAGPENAGYVAEAVLAVLGLFHDEESIGEDFTSRKLKSEYLVFLGRDNLDGLAGLVKDDLGSWLKAGEEVRSVRAKDRAKPKYKGGLEKKDDLSKRIEKAVGREGCSKAREVLTASKAVDLALFGRMLADSPELNVDAACQVAHAISTHEVSRDYDYYTAVDDLQPDDTSGAGMLGNTEFSSACYYRYANLNLDILRRNLRETALTVEGARAFLRAFIEARPGAKQNAYAAHNWPGYVLVRLDSQGQPRNLANAFEKAVRPGGEGWLEPSVTKLEEEWKWLDSTYGASGEVWGWSRSQEAKLPQLPEGTGSRPAVDRCLEAIGPRLQQLLGG